MFNVKIDRNEGSTIVIVFKFCKEHLRNWAGPDDSGQTLWRSFGPTRKWRQLLARSVMGDQLGMSLVNFETDCFYEY